MKYLLPILAFMLIGPLSAQITVVDTKIRLDGTEKMYYGFDAGDKVTLTFATDDGKTIKELEISEYPGKSKYADFNVSSVTQTITIPTKGVYEFRFRGGLKKRICSIKISRSGSDPNFKTEVIWRTVRDTTRYMIQEKYVVSADTVVKNLYDQEHRLTRAYSGQTGSRKVVTVMLPANTENWALAVGTKNEVALGLELADYKLKEAAPDSVAKYSGLSALSWIAMGNTKHVPNKVGDLNLNYYILNSINDQSTFMAGTSFGQHQSGTGSLMMEKARPYNTGSTTNARQVYVGIQNPSAGHGCECTPARGCGGDRKSIRKQRGREIQSKHLSKALSR